MFFPVFMYMFGTSPTIGLSFRSLVLNSIFSVTGELHYDKEGEIGTQLGSDGWLVELQLVCYMYTMRESSRTCIYGYKI